LGLIYLDSCLLIYLTENHPRWAERISSAMAKTPQAQFAISPLVKCECLVAPIKRGDLVLQRAYAEAFELFVPLEMFEPVYLQAAKLRAHFGLKTPDALHLSCAQHHRCESLWTNDGRLVQASHGLVRNMLQ